MFKEKIEIEHIIYAIYKLDISSMSLSSDNTTATTQQPGLSMNKFALKFVDKGQSKYVNQYDYSKVNYESDSTDVSITCVKHKHTFEITPAAHLRGAKHGGCFHCAEELRIANKATINAAKKAGEPIIKAPSKNPSKRTTEKKAKEPVNPEGIDLSTFKSKKTTDAIQFEQDEYIKVIKVDGLSNYGISNYGKCFNLITCSQMEEVEGRFTFPSTDKTRTKYSPNQLVYATFSPDNYTPRSNDGKIISRIKDNRESAGVQYNYIGNLVCITRVPKVKNQATSSK